MRIALLVTALLLSACSSSALQAHLFAGTTSRASLDLAADLGGAACSESASEAMGAAGVTPEAHARHVERCEASAGAHKLAVAAWRGYLASVLEAAAAGRRPDLSDVLRWAGELARLYKGVSAALRDLGVDAPRLPRVLEGLAGGEQ